MPQTDIPKGSFADVIATSTRGAVNSDATAHLKALVAEMQQVQRLRGGSPKGKITVDLSMVLNDNGMFETTFDFKIKHPAAAKPRAFLFASKDGTLSEEDTRQGRLDFGDVKDVPTPTAKPVLDISDRRMAQANDKP